MLAIPPADRPLDDDAAGVLAGLRRCGDLDAYVSTEVCAGERDVRLVVCRDHPFVRAELLCGEDPDGPPCWSAVLVGRTDRCVWRGPARGCPAAVVVRFVDDLLRLDPESLSRRYERVG